MSFPRYPKYKDSGVEWLGEVPEHWDVQRLKRCVRLVTAKAEERSNPLALENIEGWTGRLIPSEGDYQGEGTAFAAGDILFGKLRPYLAKVHLASQPGEAVGDFHVLRPSKRFDGHFALYHMLTREFIDMIDGSTYGSKMPRASWEFVGGMPMAVPPPVEQPAIAAFLDRETAKIDALIAEQQRLIELLQEKRQAVISHVVTKGLNPDAPMKDSGIEWLGQVPEHWRVGRLAFYVTMLSGFAFPSQGFTDDESQSRLLRGINVGVGTIRWDDVVYWNRTNNDGLDQYELQRGDLVIGMDRPLIADGMRVARLGEHDVPALLLQRVVRLTPSPHLDPEYLQHLIASEMFVAHFSPETTGVSVPHISPDQIGSFVIPIPPVAEQRAIVVLAAHQAGDLDALKEKARRSIELLQERRSALISAAVTGQIDIRGFSSGGTEAA